MVSASDGLVKGSLRRFAPLTSPSPAGDGAYREAADLWSGWVRKRRWLRWEVARVSGGRACRDPVGDRSSWWPSSSRRRDGVGLRPAGQGFASPLRALDQPVSGRRWRLSGGRRPVVGPGGEGGPATRWLRCEAARVSGGRACRDPVGDRSSWWSSSSRRRDGVGLRRAGQGFASPLRALDSPSPAGDGAYREDADLWSGRADPTVVEVRGAPATSLETPVEYGETRSMTVGGRCLDRSMTTTATQSGSAATAEVLAVLRGEGRPRCPADVAMARADHRVGGVERGRPG